MMVEEIFFLATNGKRSIKNFADGQYLIDMVSEHNYAWAIKGWWDEVTRDNVADVWRKMVWRTIDNLKGMNFNQTERSLSVQRAYLNF